MIKGMLMLEPQPTDQSILAYFTRPGRDLNHARIAEIRNGWLFPTLPPAMPEEVTAFMAAWVGGGAVDPNSYVTSPGVSVDAEDDDVVGDRQVGTLRLDWWPVGQGLFASGIIQGRNGVAVSWVYDCGTVSQQKLIKKAITRDQTARKRAGASAIKLAVLSHFDKDHISGFTTLIQTCRIETLLLPYLPLWQRLVLAIEQGVIADDPAFGFFLDPVGYLRGLGGEIGEILLVPPSGPDDAPDAPDDSEGPIEPTVMEGLGGPVEGPLKAERADPPAEASDDPVLDHQGSSEAKFLAPGGRLLSPGFWEFVPYNDVTMAARADAVFVADARALAKRLKNEETERDERLDELKRLYEAKFKNSKHRNLISLFLYSGPIGRRFSLAGLAASHPVRLPEAFVRFAQVHTGDGTLKQDYWARFRDFYRKGKRLEKAGIVQIMHHGAAGNSEVGMAARLRPVASIFSSDPAKGHKHPDAEVLRDFWPYHSIQVDDAKGFHLSALLLMR
ncbi:hypothetical protein [Novosphingobium sp. PhB55]|uniref:hypothetical protein n=1 Tax=Novosphingobium sp. PhB55 TaxID=2485106 RepID=UPI00106468CA|nr:hypothetical protein [Novosphingobium sp. PhB55]